MPLRPSPELPKPQWTGGGIPSPQKQWCPTTTQEPIHTPVSPRPASLLVGAGGVWQQDWGEGAPDMRVGSWSSPPPMCEREGEAAVTHGARPFAALPGPADLKEFVVLLFFQKRAPALHMFPLNTRAPAPLRTCSLNNCNKTNLSLQTISSPSAAAIPDRSFRDFLGQSGGRVQAGFLGASGEAREARCGCRSFPSAPSWPFLVCVGGSLGQAP